jgi:hypothetical protein
MFATLQLAIHRNVLIEDFCLSQNKNRRFERVRGRKKLSSFFAQQLQLLAPAILMEAQNA